MAQKVQVILIDDVDGGSADETVSFALDGVHYEIDLSASRAGELRAAFEPWTARARRVGPRSSRRSGKSSDVAAMRAWAKANGYAVNERGRIPAEVRQAYAAHAV
ncbi:MAG: Lsr2 family protein [Demequinaceae bacterium]|nr:Lsr2 family protein [Demequinaceae bacterium]